MAIKEHPLLGTILMCDFTGFKEPEMVKRRPVAVISPKIGSRPGLCTVVSLSGTDPFPIMPYHCQIDIEPEMPPPWNSKGVWVKGDMIYAVAFHRLDLIREGKDFRGKRLYRYQPLSDGQIKKIRECVLRGLGLTSLTKHLL